MFTQGYVEVYSVINTCTLRVYPVLHELTFTQLQTCIYIAMPIIGRGHCLGDVSYHWHSLFILLYMVHSKAYVMVTCHKLPTGGEGISPKVVVFIFTLSNSLVSPVPQDTPWLFDITLDQVFRCPSHCGPLHILFAGLHKVHQVVLRGDIVARVELRDPRKVH